MANKILIGIDASRANKIYKTGTEWYSYHLIQEMKKVADSKCHFILYSREPLRGGLENLPENWQEKVLLWPPKYLWTQIRLWWQMIFYPPDILFVPAHTLPFLPYFGRGPRKSFTTIHDLAFVYQPESYTKFQKWYLKLATTRAIKKVDKIITVSQNTKNDLIQFFRARPEKIVVIPHGYKQQTTNNPSTSLRAGKQPVSTQMKRGEQIIKRKKQILYIGRLEEKKNIINLIKAFTIFSIKYQGYRLILAGKPGVGYDKIQQQLSSLDPNISSFINILGYISEDKKRKLLEESTCLVLISKYEGFGFPLLEAFDFNLPALTSDIQVLHEIGGKACLYIDLNDEEKIARGLEKIIFDENLRKSLIEKGRERLKNYSWQKCARETLEVLTETFLPGFSLGLKNFSSFNRIGNSS